ncbi:MAG: hypothetical protein ACREAZ_05060 [Nitrososphaera sp.]
MGLLDIMMDGTLKPVLKRQLLFVGASLGTGLVFSYFFGFLVGLAANIAVLLGLMFYIRRRQLGALRSLGLGSETAGAGYAGHGVKIKYVCLACGQEVKGTRCGRCGSNMKKPLF